MTFSLQTNGHQKWYDTVLLSEFFIANFDIIAIDYKAQYLKRL